MKRDAWILPIGEPIVVSFGLLGNVLIILTIKSCRKLESLPTMFLFKALAISDLLNVSMVLLPRWIESISRLRLLKNEGNNAHFLCKIEAVYTYAGLTISSWLMTSLTLLRMIAIIFPFKFRRPVFVLRLCKLITVAVVVLSFTVHSISIFAGAFQQKNCYLGSFKEFESNRLGEIQGWLDCMIAALVPGIIILICNIILIFKLKIQTNEQKFADKKMFGQWTNPWCGKRDSNSKTGEISNSKTGEILNSKIDIAEKDIKTFQQTAAPLEPREPASILSSSFLAKPSAIEVESKVDKSYLGTPTAIEEVEHVQEIQPQNSIASRKSLPKMKMTTPPITMAIIATSVLFLTLMVPHYLAHALSLSHFISKAKLMGSLHPTFVLMMYSNNSTNIFVYLTFWSQFRNSFLKMISFAENDAARDSDNDMEEM